TEAGGRKMAALRNALRNANGAAPGPGSGGGSATRRTDPLRVVERSARRRPGGPSRQDGPPPARHRPGARSARRMRCPIHCIADHIVKEMPMSFRALLGRLVPRPSRLAARDARPGAAGRPLARRLLLEPLEDRCMPSGSGYVQTNLVSDVPGQALLHDPELVNAWGVALNPAPTGAFWISCEGTGLSTLYTGDVTRADGSRSPFAKSALTVAIPGGAPTGQVFSGSTTDFIVSTDGFTSPSRIITVSDSRPINGWAQAC